MTEKEIFQEVTIQNYGAPKINLVQYGYEVYLSPLLAQMEWHSKHEEKVAGCLYCYQPERKPLTPRQKLEREIENKKYELGKKFLAIANSLGAYNSDYD